MVEDSWDRFDEGPLASGNSISLEVRSGPKAILSVAAEVVMDAIGGGPPAPITASSSPGPRIVAVVAGREHIVQQYRSVRAAKHDLPRLNEELQSLGSDEWARSHGIPIRESGS